jgi:hypothetical protein
MSRNLPPVLLFAMLPVLSAACSSSPDAGGGGPGPGDDASTSTDGSGGDGGSMGDAASDGQGDGSIGVACTGASPSFANDVHPILQGCAGELCHGGMIQPAWPYSSLVNQPAQRDTCASAGVIVSPGSLDKSYLMHKITGVGICPGTASMPMNSSLPAKDIQTIADWICKGAANN